MIATSAGYEGGYTPNPTYEEVCSGRTGHTEAVRVVYDPAKVSYDELLRAFWEANDPTRTCAKATTPALSPVMGAAYSRTRSADQTERNWRERSAVMARPAPGRL